MSRSISDLSNSELRAKARRCRDWSKRWAVAGSAWIIVVFFTYLPLPPLPFDGWPAAIMLFGAPVAAFYVAWESNNRANMYLGLTSLTPEERRFDP